MQLNSQTPVTEVRIYSKKKEQPVTSFWFIGSYGEPANMDRALMQTLYYVADGIVRFSLDQIGKDLATELSERRMSVSLKPIPIKPAVRFSLLFGDTEEDLDVKIDVFSHEKDGYAKRDAGDEPEFSETWEGYSSDLYAI